MVGALSVLAAMMARMTITMKNYGLTWTAIDGTRCSSAVAYDEPSGKRRKQELEDGLCKDVQLVEVKPGQLPEPAA